MFTRISPLLLTVYLTCCCPSTTLAFLARNPRAPATIMINNGQKPQPQQQMNEIQRMSTTMNTEQQEQGSFMSTMTSNNNTPKELQKQQQQRQHSPRVVQLASLLTFQLYSILRQEELSLEDEDVPDTEKVDPQKRQLDALKRFGCSPIQYLQQQQQQQQQKSPSATTTTTTTTTTNKESSVVDASAETMETISQGIENGVIIPADMETVVDDDNEMEFDTNGFKFVDTGIPEYQASDYSATTKAALEEDYKLVLDMTSPMSLSSSSTSSSPVQEDVDDSKLVSSSTTLVVEKVDDSELVDTNDDTIKTVEIDADASNVEATSLTSSTTNNEAKIAPKPSPPQQQQQQPLDVVQYRKQAASISHSFRTEDFKPAWFAKNNHVQTIGGHLARQDAMYFPSVTVRKGFETFQFDIRQRFNATTTTTTTNDDDDDDSIVDFFDVDWKYADNQETVGRPSSEVPVVLICHGLQSNSHAPLCKDMTMAFNKLGMDVGCINSRGCSGEPNLTPMGYHLSFTDDLEQMVQYVTAERPNAPIYLSGFSLGANVVTKFLADQGMDAYNKYNVRGAAVNAIPFNLTRITANLNQPCFSKSLYGDRLRDSLVERIESTYDQFDHSFTLEELQACKTINEFEDLVLPSAYDFTGVHDYLTKSSVGGIVGNVMVPELVIQALDDPFMQGNINPANNPDSPFRIQYTDHGGHCGYVFHTEDADTESSWMPSQLARFIDHVHKTGNLQEKDETNKKVLSKETTKVVTPSVTKLTPSNWRSWATSVSQAFQPDEYKPAWFAKNNHLQTIMGVFGREKYMYHNPSDWLSETKPGRLSKFEWDDRQRFETPDDDFFDVDYKYLGSSKGNTLEWDDRPIVLICHGLESNSQSPLAKDMATAFNNNGMHTACINFRGCGGESNLTPTAYHLGFTDDLKQVIQHINTKYPNKRIYLSGFSLGANVVTSYLAEMGERAIDYNVLGAAVNAVPFDMTNANVNLNKDGLSKSLYGDRLLKSMIKRIEDSYDTIDYEFPIEKARECKTIMDIENLLIAPVFGFDDADDYYAKESSGKKLDRVAVPQYIVQAKDDPFFQGATNPSNERHQPVRIQYTEHGGHCGYVFHETEDEDVPQTSWMPTELARFLAYVDDTSFAASASERYRTLNKKGASPLQEDTTTASLAVER